MHTIRSPSQSFTGSFSLKNSHWSESQNLQWANLCVCNFEVSTNYALICFGEIRLPSIGVAKSSNFIVLISPSNNTWVALSNEYCEEIASFGFCRYLMSKNKKTVFVNSARRVLKRFSRGQKKQPLSRLLKFLFLLWLKTKKALKSNRICFIWCSYVALTKYENFFVLPDQFIRPGEMLGFMPR